MNGTTVRIVHPYCESPEVILEPSRYCPNDKMYLVPKNESFLQFSKTLYAIEKDRSEWIRRYDNVLNGLKYWRCRALESGVESK